MNLGALLTGEKVNICAPTEDDLPTWSSWFNSDKITQHLPQGRFPSSIYSQRIFLQKAIENDRFLGMIKSKDHELLGVISLSEIDHFKRSCQISLVCPVASTAAPLAALEAMALCSQHAFNQFGVERLWAGQSFPGLESWVRRLEILGYRTEGYFKNSFRKGSKSSDTVQTALSYETFARLTECRSGDLWPTERVALRMIEELKRLPSLASQVGLSITRLTAEREEVLMAIENSVAKGVKGARDKL
jgi:RimJ/RimL family protein N-acetyltransferase